MAEVTVRVRAKFRAWVRPLLAVAVRAPWAFAWIGADRLAAFIARHGVRVSANV